MGYRERFVDDCVIELQNGATLRLAQAPSAKSAAKRFAGELDKASDPALTGTTVWDGAVVLAQYLTSTAALQRSTPWPSGGAKPVCIELGAGTGAVGLALLAGGVAQAAVLTDLPDMLPHLRHNLTANAGALPRGGAGCAAVAPLRWGRAAEDAAALAPWGLPFDVIVGADLIYYSYSETTPHSRLLLSALRTLAAPAATLIFLALSLHHNPGEVTRFLEWAAEEGFEAEDVGSQLPEAYRVEDVRVVRMRWMGGAAGGGASGSGGGGSGGGGVDGGGGGAPVRRRGAR